MKKIISILLAVICMITMLCGCGTDDTIAIESHTWTFTVLQDESGAVVACSADRQELHENAIVAEFTAEATDGTLTLADTASGESYDLAYTVESEDPESTIYTISDTTANETTGQAVVGITEYDDGGSEYTLIVTLNGYSVYFIETIE